MSELLLTNVFFAITSISVILITTGILFLLWRVMPIVRDLREIVSRVKHVGSDVERDIQDFRATLRHEGHKAKTIVELALGYVLRKIAPKPSRKPRSDSSSKDQVNE